MTAALLLLPMLVAAATPGFEDLAALDAQIAARAASNPDAPRAIAAPLDRRLRLAKCPYAVEIDAPAMDAIAARCPALGWRVRVPLVRIAAPAAPRAALPLVHRGEMVELIYRGEGFAASASATALDDGAAGAPVRVRTGNGNAAVTAIVAAPGLVEISR